MNTESQPLDTFRRRVVIADVQPTVDAGRYAVKRVVGDIIEFSCDLLVDGHDLIAGGVKVYSSDGRKVAEVRLSPRGSDRFFGSTSLHDIGRFDFEVEAWVDEFASWQHGVGRKIDAGQDTTVELMGGQALVQQASDRARGADKNRFGEVMRQLQGPDVGQRAAVLLSGELAELMAAFPDRRFSTTGVRYAIVVDPRRALCSAWYELFPRSCGRDGKHGTFADVVELLPYISSMGFDILYLPPIHPIGHQFRKGPNNTLHAGPTDPGSPWAIGDAAGGHKEIHPELGTVEQFVHLVDSARALGLEVALDIAFQASPDHPYVEDHPEWFQHRADGSIQYAENPPKKYQDVYPFDLAGPAAKALWDELVTVFEVWMDRGVRVLRVDNPHTKPLPFWEYCIGRLKQRDPEVIFLAEAFTRPKLMYALAKVGFSQSYTYFTWRTTGPELKSYVLEIMRPPVNEFFRPNFWPNTPDILPEHLQFGGRPMFIVRAVLAATLSANWGIYGPAFELMEHTAREGAEEYVDNEKYQLRTWNLQQVDSLSPLIRRLNSIRREHAALQRNDKLHFHDTDNEHVIAYSKADGGSSDVILSVVNLDPQHRHTAWLNLDLAALSIQPGEVFQVHDLLSDARYHWHGQRAFVELDPAAIPAQIFKLRRRLRTEASFEYFL